MTYPLAENEELNEELNKVLRKVLHAHPNLLSELQNPPLPTNRPNQAVAQAAPPPPPPPPSGSPSLSQQGGQAAASGQRSGNSINRN